MTSAVVVGSGPNGLAAAVQLARHGVRVRVFEARDSIGGGTRSSVRTVEGLVHDDCSAVHPLGVASPFFQVLPLQNHGLRWLWPEIDVAHPLETGTAGTLSQRLELTVRDMDKEDGAAWVALFGPLARRFADLAGDVLGPLTDPPRHPLFLARFGLHALQPASWTVRRWHRPETRALFGGIAAHATHSLRSPLSSSIGLFLAAAGHACGWPVAAGGSRVISDALARMLTAMGGVIETGVRVESYKELSDWDVALLDISPHAAVRILGSRLPRHIARAYRRFRYGPASFKVDFAVREGIPWTNAACRRAGTVHLGGTFEEIDRAELDVQRGYVPRRPFVLVGQQYLADPSRSCGDIHPVWAYTHLPQGCHTDATQAVVERIEQFAPGFRRRILKTSVRSSRELASYNPNYVMGDINGGANNPRQLLLRPRVTLDPYSTGIPGVYLCSAATPPGPGVHGMCGFHAANRALRHLGIQTERLHPRCK